MTDPTTIRADAQDVGMASQWQLMWLRFRRHRLAVASFVLLAGLVPPGRFL